MAGDPKIAILGIHLESNRFAPPVLRPDFAEKFLAYDDELLTDSRGAHPKCMRDANRLRPGDGRFRSLDTGAVGLRRWGSGWANRP